MNVLDRFRLDGKRLFITGGSRGFGRVMDIDLDLVLPDPGKSLAEGAIKPWINRTRRMRRLLVP